MKLLHVGCANRYYEGFINSDLRKSWKGKKHKLDMQMDLGEPWPFEDGEIDGIVGMHVFQQLTWRQLIVAFREAYRVLKPDGVLRIGCPMIEIADREIEYLLGWNNINLFCEELLQKVLVGRIGFTDLVRQEFMVGEMSELADLDNRQNRGTHYFDIIK